MFTLQRNRRNCYCWWLVRATYVVDGRFFGHFFWKVVGSCAHTRESRTATVHGVLYTVNSRVVVGAIYAYMCTYSYRTRCTIHCELTCGGGGNICIHVYLQLPYTVHCTWCTIHGELTCGGGIHMWELLMCAGDIHMWELFTCGEAFMCGGDIHMYLQLLYMVYHTRCTHVWWWGQYTHTCVPTATVHGELMCGGGGTHTWCTVHSAPCTVHTVHSELTCAGDIHMWELLTCETSHQSEILHSSIF